MPAASCLVRTVLQSRRVPPYGTLSAHPPVIGPSLRRSWAGDGNSKTLVWGAGGENFGVAVILPNCGALSFVKITSNRTKYLIGCSILKRVCRRVRGLLQNYLCAQCRTISPQDKNAVIPSDSKPPLSKLGIHWYSSDTDSFWNPRRWHQAPPFPLAPAP